MSNHTPTGSSRRGFLKGTSAGLVAGGTLLDATAAAAATKPLTEKEKLDRIASNSWPLRHLFKTRSGYSRREESEKMKAKYGEITMLDFPAFTKKTFPGVTHMDIFSGLLGDMDDESQYVKVPVMYNGKERMMTEFDPDSDSGKKWLDKMANVCVKEGTKVHHISNNAPRDICDLDVEKRKAGVAVAKRWLDGAAKLGAKSMRVNSGGPRIAPSPNADPSSYPKNPEIEKYLTNCIESFKEMADYGGKLGVKVTLENHWGLTANPINIRIIIEEVNNPFCEASPDFCNWEHKYLLFHALRDLAPYAHTTVHAKYWDRWENPDVQRNVRIMKEANYQGKYALEYEEGPWDCVEGPKYLYKEVLAAL